MTLDELQSLTVMSYRTATALTTEADLQEYFSNYKILYSNSDIMFIKKRNDIYERIYSAFIIMKNNDYIYKTNTLNIDLNLSDMENPEKTIFMIHPGTLFTANPNEHGYVDFYRDTELSAQNDLWYQEYLEEKANGNIPYVNEGYDRNSLPDYLKDRQASFAEFKRRKGYIDKVSVFDYDTAIKKMSLNSYDDPHHVNNNHFLYINPFLIRFKKNPNLMSMYMTYINQSSTVDFTYKYDDSYVQFIIYQLKLKRGFTKEKKYKMSISLMPTIGISSDYPIINGIVSTDEYGNEEIEYELNNPYNTFNNDLRVFVLLNDGVKNVCYIELCPEDYNEDTDTFTFSSEFLTDDHITTDGRLRLLDETIYKRLVYQKCISTSVNAFLVVDDDIPETLEEAIEKYGEENIKEDDLLLFNSSTMLRKSDVIKDIPDIEGATQDTDEEQYQYVQIGLSDDYYKVSDTDYTIYYHYNADGEVDTDINGDMIEYSVDSITEMVREGKIRKWCRVVNITSSSEILVPMENVVCTVYTSYRRRYNEETRMLELVDYTVDPFYDYEKGFSVRLQDMIYGEKEIDSTLFDSTIDRYFVTNEYKTASDPVTFLKPLNNVRSNLIFKDYTLTKKVTNNDGEIVTEYVNDIMDVSISSIPFIRWSETLDEDSLEYFMNSFLAQYNNIIDIINTKLRNETSVDIKFYNTYGRSKNFIIGEEEEKLDTVNLTLSFDIWYTPGTDLLTATPNVKEFIKTEIETINSDGLNNLYISNLMRKIESNFAYVDHIRFNYINQYDPKYQAVKNYVTDLSELSVSERRDYVPEFLVIDIEDITINEYFSS